MMTKSYSFLFVGLGLLLAHSTLAQQTIGGTTAPGSTLQVNGSLAASYQQVTTSPYAMAATDYYVVYNGSAAGTIALPAAGSGSGALAANFKGRIYTIKNTTAAQTLTVTPNGSETIDGNTSVSVGAGQSVQLVSTGQTGAAVTWEIVSFNSASSTGCTPGYILATVTSQRYTTSPASNISTYLVQAANGISQSGGVFTLVAGNTYELQASLYGQNITVNSGSTTGSEAIAYQWVDANNAALPGNGAQIAPVTATYNDAPNPVTTSVYTPTTNVQVRLRVVGGNSSANLTGYAFIKQLNACPGGSGTNTNNTSGNTTASNGLTASNGNVTLGGTLAQNTNVATAGYNLTLSGTGNLGIGTISPASKIDVTVDNSNGGGMDDTNFRTYGTPSIGHFDVASRGTVANPANLQNGDLLALDMKQGQVNGSLSSLSAIAHYYRGSGTTALSDMRFTTSTVERMRIDQNGYVGMGTTSPGANLHIASSDFGAYNGFYIQDTGGGNQAGLTITPGYDGGTASASSTTLDVPGNGNLVFSDNLIPAVDNGWPLGLSTRRWNTVYSTNGTIQTSDRRLKTNIQPSGYGLRDVLRMRPVTYNWKTQPTTNHMVGFIAQELETIVPEAVVAPKSADEYYGMKYEALIPVLTAAIQEQQQQIEALKAANAKLQAQANDSVKAQAELQDVKASLQSLAEQVKLLQAGGALAATK